ncbi:GtrA family protein [Komagataeibacter nataicola]|nr:GtrA family protein [Komagataeibacter nataicola]
MILKEREHYLLPFLFYWPVNYSIRQPVRARPCFDSSLFRPPAFSEMKDRPVFNIRSDKLQQFIKFGIVGVLGLGWDTATLYSLRPFVGLTAATIAAYFIAASINWLINRFWTFRKAGNQHHFFIQWLRFLAGNAPGFLLNRSCVFILFHVSPVFRAYPFLALAAGSVTGMMANFHISCKMVFHSKTPATPRQTAEILPFQPERPVPQNAVSSRTAVANARNRAG